jgi:hypothetical protein
VRHAYAEGVDPYAALAQRTLVERRGWPAPDDAARRHREWFRSGVRFYVDEPADLQAPGTRRRRLWGRRR